MELVSFHELELASNLAYFSKNSEELISFKKVRKISRSNLLRKQVRPSQILPSSLQQKSKNP